MSDGFGGAAGCTLLEPFIILLLVVSGDGVAAGRMLTSCRKGILVAVVMS